MRAFSSFRKVLAGSVTLVVFVCAQAAGARNRQPERTVKAATRLLLWLWVNINASLGFACKFLKRGAMTCGGRQDQTFPGCRSVRCTETRHGREPNTRHGCRIIAAANPGLTPSFRRGLPETGCLSQGLPHGKVPAPIAFHLQTDLDVHTKQRSTSGYWART